MCSGGAREDVDGADAFLQCRRVHILDLGARDRGLSVAKPKQFGDGGSGDLVVAGDHGDPDAAAVTLLYGVDGLLARRIQQADQAEQDERPRQVCRSETASLHIWIL